MNLTLDETQVELRGLAARIFAGRGEVDRVAQLEASNEAFDRDLWRELAAAGLLGVAIPAAHGGLGFGSVELALVCEELGRVLAPVPLVPTACAAQLLADAGSSEQQQRWLPAICDGSVVVAVAAPQSAVGVRCEGGRVSGELIGLAWAHVADLLLVPIGDTVVAIDPAADGMTATRGRTTAREVALTLTLDRVAAEPVGTTGAAGWLQLRWLTALAALQAGVTDAAVRMTASYTSTREQFGKPLSTFQIGRAQGRGCLPRHDGDPVLCTAGGLVAGRGHRCHPRSPGGRLVGGRRWPALRASDPALARRDGRGHHLPGAPILLVGQADRAPRGRCLIAAGRARRCTRRPPERRRLDRARLSSG